MPSRKIKPAGIEEYIDTAPPETQAKLLQLHECIRKAAPGAAEGLKWSMPAYSYNKILVTFAMFKHHIGFYPMASAVKAFAKKLTNYRAIEGRIRFPLDKLFPLFLIGQIVKFRVRESKA